MKKLLFALALLASPAVFAQEGGQKVGGYVNGGLSFASYELEDSDDFGLELEGGTGFNLTGGFRFSPGFQLRAQFTQTKHDGGDFTFDGDFDGSFDEEVTLSEFRAGFL